MNKDKLNEIGTKLNVDASDVKQRNIQNIIIKPLYFLIQIAIFGLSVSIGRYLIRLKENATYPYNFYQGGISSALFLLILHGGNGSIALPGQKMFGWSRKIRISIFLVTLLASLIAIQHYLSMLPTISYPRGVEYGVYSKDFRSKSVY